MRRPRFFLMVQCCHLPQFFYAARRLQEKHPDWELEALVVDHPQVRYYLGLFSCFSKVRFFSGTLPQLSDSYGGIIYPLFNRGYLRIKRAAGGLAFPFWQVDYQGNLEPLTRARLWFSALSSPLRPSPEFVRFLKAFPHRPLGEKILFLESCHFSLIAATESEWRRLIPAQAEITRVRKKSLWQLWKEMRRSNFDGAIVFFSGEPGLAALKVLPFLLRLPKILIFNENGHHFYANARSLLRFLYERVRYGTIVPRPVHRVLFVQTEAVPYVFHALKTLKTEKLFPDSEIMVVGREPDRPLFDTCAHVGRFLSYSRWSLPANLAVSREVARFNPDVVCAIFSGRPVFRKQKLFFFLQPAHRHLVFNARLDCYDLTPRTFLRIFRKEPLLFELPEEKPEPGQHVLLIQTESDALTKRAMEVLRDHRITPDAQVSVFCEETKRAVFEPLPGVRNIFIYRKGHPWKNLQTVRRMIRLRPEVVAAILSGRPIYARQKLLFYLLPARSRLVLNEHLICFYLKKEGVTQSAGLFSRRVPDLPPGKLFLRNLAKILLLVPRFFYLVTWVTLSRRKDNYSVSQEK